MEKSKSQMAEILSQEEILRYLELVDRRLYIIMHSGVDWKPEYAQELEEIDAGLATLGQRVDAALEAKEARTENALASEDDLLLDDMEHQQIKDEVRQAYLNGGRTPYLYDIDGNEYYTTRDGIRHYTRVEG